MKEGVQEGERVGVGQKQKQGQLGRQGHRPVGWHRRAPSPHAHEPWALSAGTASRARVRKEGKRGVTSHPLVPCFREAFSADSRSLEASAPKQQRARTPYP